VRRPRRIGANAVPTAVSRCRNAVGRWHFPAGIFFRSFGVDCFLAENESPSVNFTIVKS